MRKLLIFLILSIPIGDRINIAYDKCDYAEINTFYSPTGDANFRQIIFWEWRKVENHNKETGVITYQWGYGVKGWKRLRLKRELIVGQFNAQGSNDYQPAKSITGWYSTWVVHENTEDARIYQIDYRYVIETHTTYDPEVYNRKFVPVVMRTGFR